MQLTRKNGLYESSRVLFVDVADISPNPSQPRSIFDEDALAELAASISRYGILQPLTVRRRARSFELVSGERRLRAAKLAGLNQVPCIVLEVDMEESSLIALVENLQRHDLDFFEEAEGLFRLIKLFGMSQEEAARRIGKSQSAVANKLRLLRLPPEIISLLREHDMAERHARALLRLPTDEKRMEALKTMIAEGMNVARAERYVAILLGEAEEDAEEERLKRRRRYIFRDVRLFLNTLDRGLEAMKSSGIDAVCGRCETDTDIILTIKLPKQK